MQGSWAVPSIKISPENNPSARGLTDNKSAITYISAKKVFDSNKSNEKLGGKCEHIRLLDLKGRIPHPPIRPKYPQKKRGFRICHPSFLSHRKFANTITIFLVTKLSINISWSNSLVVVPSENPSSGIQNNTGEQHVMFDREGVKTVNLVERNTINYVESDPEKFHSEDIKGLLYFAVRRRIAPYSAVWHLARRLCVRNADKNSHGQIIGRSCYSALESADIRRHDQILTVNSVGINDNRKKIISRKGINKRKRRIQSIFTGYHCELFITKKKL
uniref:Ribosomal protein L22 n=1 Tax=Romanomermis culicivorax TaxID=13658 RepID=A0A915LD22_ROMCU